MPVVVPVRIHQVDPRRVLAVAIGLGVFAALRLLGEASVDLAAIAGVCAAGLQRPRSARRALEPFSLRIEPDWDAIQRDHPLAPPEDLKRLLAYLRDSHAYLPRSIAFTVLSEELAFDNKDHSFFSRLDIEEYLPEPDGGDVQTSPSLARSVFVELGLDGYYLGIRSQKEALARDLPAEVRGRMTLATLPHIALAGHWDGASTFWPGRRRRRIKKVLAKHGWLEEPRTVWPLHQPVCLKHKYFTVYHTAV